MSYNETIYNYLYHEGNKFSFELEDGFQNIFSIRQIVTK